MSNFYIKNREGKYLPVEVTKSILSKDLEGHLVIIRVGTDEHPASVSDLDITEESFSQADVLNDLEDISVIITPYQIDTSVMSKEEADNKHVCLQITSGNDLATLGEHLKNMYKKLRNKFNLVILPAPLKVGEFRRAKDILKRSKIRKERRSRAKG